MPLPFLAVAIPVVHSSGGWIASTAATGYISGTLSSTWIGAFVLGNSSLLSSLGLVSAAGVFGASGGLAGLASSTAMGIGSALTAVGLGGVASSLGIAPVATFLGLTPTGWAIAGVAAIIASTIGYYFTHKIMLQINEERGKGGLGVITIAEIVEEVKLLETRSIEKILTTLASEGENISLSTDRKEAKIDGQIFSIHRLKYIVNPDGSEEIVFVTRTCRTKRILLVKKPSEPEGNPA